MTISAILKKYRQIEIDLLLAHVLGKSREFLYTNLAYEIGRKQAYEIDRLAIRRLRGEPMAYILGYKDFCGLRFKVNQSVLIPRPETEWAVERIRNYELGIRNGKQLKILDIGTGSGCIAISLAKNPRPATRDPQLTASDVSAKALEIAKQNAKTHGVEIKFIKSDLLENVKGNFDVIIANLPYGWTGWENNTSAETIGLKFEPKAALFATDKGLSLINKLLKQIAALKSKPQFIYLEFDPRQKFDLHRQIKKILPQGKVKFYRDFNNFWRYAEIII